MVYLMRPWDFQAANRGVDVCRGVEASFYNSRDTSLYTTVKITQHIVLRIPRNLAPWNLLTVTVLCVLCVVVSFPAIGGPRCDRDRDRDRDRDYDCDRDRNRNRDRDRDRDCDCDYDCDYDYD